MSKARSYDSGSLENQFILRLPQKQADFVRHAINTGGLKEKLSIEFQADNRHATVRVNGEALSSKLVDLPCIIESHKTLDCKSLYKTADVSQLLVCTDEDHDSQGEEDSKHKKESKKFVWNHGITSPLKNSRKKRFRKMAKKKVSESPEIEKEVKRILRTDLSAATVTFEVKNDEEKADDSQNISLPSDIDLPGNSPSSMRNLSQIATNSDDEDRNELLKLLQEASSDEDDEDELERSQDNYDDDVDIEVDDEFDQGLKSQLEDAKEKLEEIRSSKAQQIARVNGAANPFLKERFQKILEGILQQEKDQEQELEKIENELAEMN